MNHIKVIMRQYFTRFIFTILVFVFLLKSPPPVLAQTLSSFEFSNIAASTPKTAGLPFQITITAKDEFDATLTTFESAVTLDDSTSSIFPTQATFENGVWTGFVYITQASTATSISATYSTVSDLSSSLQVDADSRIKFLTITQGNNQTGTVGQQLPTTLELKVVDPYSNPLSNVGVNFAISSAPPGATTQSLTNYSTVSNSNGLASTSLTFGKKKGVYVITGTLASGITNTAHFYETANASQVVSISLNPSIGVIPGGSMLPFTAQGYDIYANLVDLSSVTWSVQNGGGTIDATGVFYAGTTLGVFSNTVKAIYGTIGTTATVNIVGTAGAGSASGSALPTSAPVPTPTPQTVQQGVLSEVLIDPALISALLDAEIPIIAEGVDAFGQPVSDVTYDFSVLGDLGTIAQTAANAVLLTVGQSGLGAIQVTATQGQLTTTTTAVGSVGNGINRRLVIEDITSPQYVGEPFTISIAAKDSQNNFITDYEGPIVLADSTGTIDPATVQPSDSGIWYVQAVINLSHPEVSVTAAGDGMVGVSNIFEVIGQPSKDDIGLGGGLGQGFGQVLGASISALLDQLLLDRNLNKYTIFRYIGSGLAAGFGILGASIGGGIMVSRGLEAIGRNPFAKGRLKINLYASLVAFILVASLAVFAAFLILR